MMAKSFVVLGGVHIFKRLLCIEEGKLSMVKPLSLEKRALLLLGAYFILQLIIRLTVSPGMEKDEAEQVLLTQQLSLGYDSQPPLYTWLQSLFFTLYGENIFALALLKNLLLFSTYLFTYKISRALGYSVVASIAAMLSLFFIPQIAWESQRDLTHSVLVTTLTAVTVFFWISLKNKQSLSNYLLVGLFCGLALISKYNSSVFLLGMLAASLSIREYRVLFLSPRILIPILTMLAVVVPHLVWGYSHLQQLLAATGKLHLASEENYISSVMQGSASLFAASLTFSLLLLLVYLILQIRSWRKSDFAVKPKIAREPNLLLRSILLSLAICLLMVMFFQVTSFKDRWMQPVLFLLPVALLPYMQSALVQNQGRLMRRIGTGMAIFILFAFSVRVISAPYSGVTTNLNYPYHAIASKISKQASYKYVLSQSSLLGGHLRLLQPQVKVVIPGTSRLNYNINPDSLLVVWERGSNWRDDKRLSRLVKKIMGEDYREVPIPSINENFEYLPDQTMTVSSVMLERMTP
jgi:4-amino-4-deoxy-L-arabinose transferase-like glycosyltransferase